MNGNYQPGLVALSVVVAIIASYTALDLAGRVSAANSSSRRAWAWLFVGAFSMGIGIWSMHFIGMLAFHLPVPIAYDVGITGLSLVVAIGVSAIALYILRRPALDRSNLTIGATLMGVGIAAMHYTGMTAMRMSPAIQYDPVLFIGSVLVAIVASLAALWIAFQLRRRHSRFVIFAKLGSAALMGFAIVGMHYLGMAAARFAPDSVCLAAAAGGVHAGGLATIIGVFTVLILGVTLVVSSLDAHFASNNARLAQSLQVANEQLRSVALYDSLTGLPNRILLDDRMRQTLLSAGRTGRPFALLFIDLDRFKPVNDTFGHSAGDELLKTVAQRLTACLRKCDTVGRIGGDEFLLLLPELEKAEDAAVAGNRILAELRRPFAIQGNELSISCSIGISIYPQDGTDLAILTANADSAMYWAKQEGRDGFRLFAQGAAAAAVR